VTGRVQGVGYRARFVDEACSLGCTGYIRNLPDGSVEAVIEGKEGDLNRLVEFSRAKRDPFIRVHTLTAEWSEARGDLPEFRIIYT